MYINFLVIIFFKHTDIVKKIQENIQLKSKNREYSSSMFQLKSYQFITIFILMNECKKKL